MILSRTIKCALLCCAGLTTGASIEPATVPTSQPSQEDPCLYFDDWREKDWLFDDYVHQKVGSPPPPPNDPWPFGAGEWELVHQAVPASEPRHDDGPSLGWTLIERPFHPVHHLACHPGMT